MFERAVATLPGCFDGKANQQARSANVQTFAELTEALPSSARNSPHLGSIWHALIDILSVPTLQYARPSPDYLRPSVILSVVAWIRQQSQGFWTNLISSSAARPFATIEPKRWHELLPPLLAAAKDLDPLAQAQLVALVYQTQLASVRAELAKETATTEHERAASLARLLGLTLDDRADGTDGLRDGFPMDTSNTPEASSSMLPSSSTAPSASTTTQGSKPASKPTKDQEQAERQQLKAKATAAKAQAKAHLAMNPVAAPNNTCVTLPTVDTDYTLGPIKPPNQLRVGGAEKWPFSALLLASRIAEHYEAYTSLVGVWSVKPARSAQSLGERFDVLIRTFPDDPTAAQITAVRAFGAEVGTIAPTLPVAQLEKAMGGSTVRRIPCLRAAEVRPPRRRRLWPTPTP